VVVVLVAMPGSEDGMGLTLAVGASATAVDETCSGEGAGLDAPQAAAVRAAIAPSATARAQPEVRVC
jgi:hypothetical protein